MRRSLRLALLFTFSLFIVPAAFAQNQETRDDRAALLPDIDAQDIEIRGDFRARFPGISRQPILGFSPTPRVFRIDPNRMPFMESPEEVMASFPLSELQPNMGPERQLKESPQQSWLYATAGIGNFVSPEANAFFSLPLSERTRVTGNLDWLSSQGHFEDSSVDGAFRRAGGEVSLNSRLTTNGSFLASIRGRSDFSDLPERIYRPETINLTVRDGRSAFDKMGGSLGWVSQRSAFDRFEIFAHYDYTTFESGAVTVLRPYSGFESRADEHRFGAQTSFSWAGRNIGQVFKIEAELDAALYENRFVELTDIGPGSVQHRDWFVAGAGGFWQFDLPTGDRFRAGARAFVGHDPVQELTVMVYPYVNWQTRRTGPLQLEAEISGYMRNTGLEPLLLENRTLSVPGTLQNERTFYGNFLARYTVNTMISATAGLYSAYTLRPIMFTPTFQTGGNTGWVQPEDLFLIRPSVGAAVNISPRWLNLYADAYLTITEMSKPAFSSSPNTDKFAGLENYRITAGFRSTPFRHANVSLWADVIGTRKQLLLDTNEGEFSYTSAPGGVFLLNARAEYRIGGNIGFYVKALNLLNQRYEIWQGYEERPLQVFGGLSIKL